MPETQNCRREIHYGGTMHGLVKRMAIVGFLFLANIAICSAQVKQVQEMHSAADYLASLSQEERKDYAELKADWDKRRRTDPNGFAKLVAKMTVQAQMILGRLGYGTKFAGILDAQTQDALRSYQENKKIPVGESMDALTYYCLTSDDEVADKQLIDFGNYRFGWYDDYFSGSGAWD
jgi:hypothetical protein